MSKLPRSDAPGPVERVSKSPRYMIDSDKLPDVPKSQSLSEIELWEIFPRGWWICCYPDCPVGVHGLGERRCVELKSKPIWSKIIPSIALWGAPQKTLKDAHEQGKRDPIQDLYGCWFCPAEDCQRRVLLDVSKEACECGLTTSRDSVVKAAEAANPEPSTLEYFERRKEELQGYRGKGKGKQIRERTPEEGIDVMKGGLDGGKAVVVRKREEKAKVGTQKEYKAYDRYYEEEFDKDHGEGFSDEPESWLY
ncbi:hypothetical protein MFRU_005g01230 [Monilinia fructicola]|nr:hypothetical protein MFRU_005g01230 [Monilinia fructicola]